MFCQAAVHDPTLHWDTIKEDIYVWAITQHHNTGTSPFRDRLPISTRLGPPSAESGKATLLHATYTAEGKEICKRYNAGRCTRGEECIFTHVCWHPGCQGESVRQKSAFRIVLVWPQECELLGMKWKEAYYVNTCLPFGLRSAPYLFNQFVKVLQWILQHNYGLQWLVHYLDDYLIVGAPDSHSCSEHLQCFLRHLQEFLPKWNGTSQLSTNNPTDAPDLELYTDTGTHGCGVYFQGEWFHNNWQPHQQLSNGKNSSQLSLQPSLGATIGGKSVSDSTVTTSGLSTRGKANLPSIPVSCPCWARFFSQWLKITLPYPSNICLGNK